MQLFKFKVLYLQSLKQKELKNYINDEKTDLFNATCCGSSIFPIL